MSVPLPRFLSALIISAIPLVAWAGHSNDHSANPFFRIQVIDSVSGRGVPLVEFLTVNGTAYYTDSAGMIAFYEPGLMGEEIYFHISSHGYQYPADFFGYRGIKLTPVSGAETTVQLQRINIAERLYRLTGAGIYRDSSLLGDTPPIAKPLINGLVAGQDSALALPFKGQLYWFWGDTSRPAYPLGNFKVSGATAPLPSTGGLSVDQGIDYTYWVNGEGFSREMAPVAGSGVVWLGGLQAAADPNGNDKMFAHFVRLAGLGSPIEQGLVIWNESTEVFEKVSNIPLDNTLHGHGAAPFKFVDQGVEYIYFGNPYPNLRVKSELALVNQPDQFQGYTPMIAGTRFDGANTQLEKDFLGNLIWQWKANTPPITPAQQRELVNLNMMQRSESPYRLRDFDTDKHLVEHNGTVAWNEYRQKWIMILGVTFASESLLGEIYAAEADNIEGPWTRARKIVTHDHYSFYNVAQRSFLDQAGGRYIYFEGTYTKMFSSAPVATPRYNYNQVMYRLDLADPRLYQP